MREILVALSLFMGVGAPAAAREPALTDRDRSAIAALAEVRIPTRRGEAPVPVALAQKMADLGVPGLSVAYFENGQVRWARTFGRASAASPRRLTPRTRFQAASMSKAVTAVLALRQVDRGTLSLDGGVNATLRSWRIPGNIVSAAPVSLRQLLSHTAGLSLDGYPGYAWGAPLPTVAQSLAGAPPANTAPVTRIAAPGTRASYSGGGYTVVQQLLIDASRTPFAALALRDLFRPLGLGQTRFDQPLAKADRMAAADGHDTEGATIAGGGNVYPELAAAGLWTTPSDYARFVIALQDAAAGKPGAILKPATVAAMTTPVLDGEGLGVRIMTREGRTAIAHSGSNAGYRCQFVAYLDGAREGAVVMTNGDNGGLLIGHVLRTLDQHYGWVTRGAPPSRSTTPG